MGNGEIDTLSAARSEIFGIFFWLDRNIFFTSSFKLPVSRVQTTRLENNTVRERQAGKIRGKGYNAALTQKLLIER